MISLITETGIQQVGAAVSGLGGVLTGGGAVGEIQKKQQSEYEKMIARRDGDKEGEKKAIKNKAWKPVAGKIVGGIPVVGSIGNVMNQRKLDKLKANIDNNSSKQKT